MRAKASSATEEPGSPIEYAVSRQGVTGGNRTHLLIGGLEAFPAMLGAIASAEREVLLESYIIADDATGRSFFAALIAAAKRGVDVRLICDGFGSFAVPTSAFDALAAAGVKSLIYRPVAPWQRRWGLLRRDHRKLLTVDRRVGFVGGLNLSDDYDGYTRAGEFWRDLHLTLEGPAVSALASLFASTWNHESVPALRMTWEPPMHLFRDDTGGSEVQVIGNHETRHRSLIRSSFLHAVHRARRTIRVANPYFIPDHTVAQALARAARRGVDVRVLVPERSDVLLVDLAARTTFPRLLRAGVRIAEWGFGMMHAKAASVDGRWATVGSYNLDRRSLRYNLEVTANVFDETFATALETHLTTDFDRSSEINLELFRGRSLWLRLMSWIAYQLRAWL